MSGWPGRLLAGAIGAIVGALVVLALPVPGSVDAPVDPPPRSPRLEPVEISTLLVWTPGGIPTELTERLERLSAIRDVTVVRSGTAWLGAWGDEDGVRYAPKGFAIPIEVAAVEEVTYRRFVPPSDRIAIARLRDGGALLGDGSAELRDLDVGGHLSVGSTTVEVEGVIDDTLIGAHEAVVGLDEGRRLGIERPRYVLVAPAPHADAGRVEAAIRRAVPAGTRVRIRRPGETPVFRHGDAVLPQIRIKELFGEFAAVPRGDGTLAVDAGWHRRNIATARLPVLGPVRCHRLVLPLVRAAIDDLVTRGLGGLLDPGDFGGCYYPRFIARDAGAGISHHSWGIAIDVNVSEGLPGREPTLDERVVEAFENQGFIWGGRFLIPDGTHFEFRRFP